MIFVDKVSLSLVLFYTPILLVLLYFLVNLLEGAPKNVCIIVIVDIGRSRQVQYHAISSAIESFRLYLVSYQGSTSHKNILQNDNIENFHVHELPAALAKVPRSLGYSLKVVQSTLLVWTLLLPPNMSTIVIQKELIINANYLSSLKLCKFRFCDLEIYCYTGNSF